MPSFLEEQIELIGSFEHTPKTRREAIRTFLPELIEDGYSRRRALSLFREYELGINKKAFDDIYNDIRFSRYLDNTVLHLPRDEKISELNMHVSRTNIRAKHLYVVQYGLYDEEGEFLERREWGLASNDLLSKNEVMERILDRMDEFGSVNPENVVGMSVRKVFVNPDL